MKKIKKVFDLDLHGSAFVSANTINRYGMRRSECVWNSLYEKKDY
ncbi:hypothetical protein [Dubosiella newyorkensis]